MGSNMIDYKISFCFLAIALAACGNKQSVKIKN